MKPQPRYHRGDKIGRRYLVHQALMGSLGEVYLYLDLRLTPGFIIDICRILEKISFRIKILKVGN